MERKKILIRGIYKSPNSGIENHANLFNILNYDYIKVHKNIVIVGDFNFLTKFAGTVLLKTRVLVEQRPLHKHPPPPIHTQSKQ